MQAQLCVGKEEVPNRLTLFAASTSRRKTVKLMFAKVEQFDYILIPQTGHKSGYIELD